MKDSFGRDVTYLRLSVTDRCNLRCRYCMPEEGVCKKRHDEMLTEEEMISAVEAAASIGVRKVRITGGEPLIKKNILSICRRAAKVPGIEELCITTNGTMLAALASELKEAGVSRVNISLDSLNEEKYARITRLGDLKSALAGLAAALEAGFDKVKLNTVLIGGFNDDEIENFVQLTMKLPISVRFIELMPMYDGGDFGPEAFADSGIVLEKIPELVCEGRDGVARVYRLPGAAGTVGLISPVTKSFCSGCDRLRLTADGKLKPCLHSGSEYNVKGMSREEMKQAFFRAVQEKPACHGELSCTERSAAGRNMNEIGG